jgi:uncharacterized protein YpmB
MRVSMPLTIGARRNEAQKAKADRKKEESVMRKKLGLLIITSALVVVLLSCSTLWAQKSEEKERAELAEALKTAKVSLQDGLSASAREGKPISAKFEVEDGKLLLSVYTMKGGKFSEVVVDHASGKISKTESITEGEDLVAAKAQSEAMSKAKQSLRAALAKARKSNPVFRAVSIIPSIKDGHPIAEVTLVKGDQWKSVSVKLD